MENQRHGSDVHVLVVDDDPTVSEVVARYLDRAGFAVDRAADGPAALRAAAERWPHLVVLDLMLPGMDGLEVCRALRAQGPVPVIMLTARGDEDDRILGLEIGADDYVTKPFSPRELVLRVESVLRRARAAQGREGPRLRAAGIDLDPRARRVTRDGHDLALTLREFDLLAYLLRRPGQVCGREQLMREVWGWEFGDLSTVTVHVRRLRGKIEDDPARPLLIRTVWGVGYRFDVPVGSGGTPGEVPVEFGGPPEGVRPGLGGTGEAVPTGFGGTGEAVPADFDGPPEAVRADRAGPPEAVRADRAGPPEAVRADRAGPPEAVRADRAGPPEVVPAGLDGRPEVVPADLDGLADDAPRTEEG
ncbi:response regulator transcription factor [Streptomyces sp. H27-C3]|uniref:response regulator transcription factor n=1 Tax=Streptomyces sp. H27-C3 TaxID=3046305 RepID=UPI0024BA0F6B|nr:response regulator transcription factor [Streptomyces sp. H27-C3]MDJ0464145.1 response regulator transcription factor [Streptomyces sp. H27-C3]